MNKILLVEDDESLGYILKEYLQLNGYQIIWAKDGKGALKEIDISNADMIILDVNLPDEDGYAVAEKIRAINSVVPFIFLTARRLKVDKLKGFKLGAEDFITKPVDEEELLARIEVVLRRSKVGAFQTGKMKLGTFIFFPADKQLVDALGKSVSLTEIESSLLGLMLKNEGHLLNKKEIMKSIWKEDNYFTRRSMDVFVSRLRKILSTDQSIKIKTVHGKGYVLSLERS